MIVIQDDADKLDGQHASYYASVKQMEAQTGDIAPRMICRVFKY